MSNKLSRTMSSSYYIPGTWCIYMCAAPFITPSANNHSCGDCPQTTQHTKGRRPNHRQAVVNQENTRYHLHHAAVMSHEAPTRTFHPTCPTKYDPHKSPPRPYQHHAVKIPRNTKKTTAIVRRVISHKTPITHIVFIVRSSDVPQGAPRPYQQHHHHHHEVLRGAIVNRTKYC